MPFSIGAEVVVVPLGRKRAVVVEAGRGGRYRVQVNGVTISCREEDLASPPPPRASRAGAPASRTADVQPSSDTPPPGRVDLHGRTVEEALEDVTREIDIAAQRGADRIEVVHGMGSGRVKNAVHRHLASLGVVATFRLDPRNPGVTWVWLR